MNELTESPVESVVEETVESSTDEHTHEEEPSRERDTAARNLVELRKEREELQRKLWQYEAAAKKQHVPVEEDEDEFSLHDEAVAEGKHLKNVLRKQKKLEEELRAFKEKASQEMIENRVRARYADYDQIVNDESIRILAEEEPELVYMLQSSNDLFNKASYAYKEIKRRGIVANNRSSSALSVLDKKKALENSVKPRPMVGNSPRQGDSPLSQANAFEGGLTKELAAQLRKEMAQYSR
jgi:hypothetical protein